GKSVEVTDDGFLKRIRVAQFSNDVTRVVLDVSDVSEYSAFLLPNPWRLIIDVHGSKPGTLPAPQLMAKQQQQPVPTQTTAASTPSAFPTPPPPEGAPLKQQQAKPSAAVASPPPQPSAQMQTAASGTTAQPGSSLKDIQSLDRQPNRVKATKHPTT